MRRARYAAAFIALLFTASGTASAQASPTEFLKAQDEKLKPLLSNASQNKDKILKVINKMLDFDSLCRDSLGKHWNDKNAAEQKEFSDTLRALIEKNLVDRLGANVHHEIKYESEEVDGNEATVTTAIAAGKSVRDEQTEIAYKLRKSGDKWAVVDIVTNGVSLVANYRSQFNKIITKDGWAALMKKMKDKLAE